MERKKEMRFACRKNICRKVFLYFMVFFMIFSAKQAFASDSNQYTSSIEFGVYRIKLPEPFLKEYDSDSDVYYYYGEGIAVCYFSYPYDYEETLTSSERYSIFDSLAESIGTRGNGYYLNIGGDHYLATDMTSSDNHLLTTAILIDDYENQYLGVLILYYDNADSKAAHSSTLLNALVNADKNGGTSTTVDHSSDHPSLKPTKTPTPVPTPTLRNSSLSAGVAEFNTGIYSYITENDLYKFRINLVGTKVYLIIKDPMFLQSSSTLSYSSVQNSTIAFNVGSFFSSYRSMIKDGEYIGILGTIEGYKDGIFLGPTITLKNCKIFALGNTALSYKSIATDSNMNPYCVVTEEVVHSSPNVITRDEYKAVCQSYSYESILRNPDYYDGKLIKLTGTVHQIYEGIFNTTIYINDNSSNKWGCVYSYSNNEKHLMEGDYVTIYGECDGTGTTTNLLGMQITMPKIDVKYLW